MRRTFKYGGPIVAACIAMIGLPSAFADTTTTVVTKTTTVNTLPPLTLPATSSYVLVDPLTGAVRGDYVAGMRVFEGIPLSSNFVVMDKSTRRVVGSFDASGNLIDIAMAPATTRVVVTVNSHRAALEKQISDLLAQGQISSNQAADMRLEIARLFAAGEPVTTTRTITYSDALAADSGLYTVQTRLLPLMSKSYTSVVTMPRFISVNGKLIVPDTLAFRRMQLERRMEDEFAYGHLTRGELIKLKADINEIANRDARWRVDGIMPAERATILTADLNALQAKMDRDVASVDAGNPL